MLGTPSSIYCLIIFIFMDRLSPFRIHLYITSWFFFCLTGVAALSCHAGYNSTAAGSQTPDPCAVSEIAYRLGSVSAVVATRQLDASTGAACKGFVQPDTYVYYSRVHNSNILNRKIYINLS